MLIDSSDSSDSDTPKLHFSLKKRKRDEKLKLKKARTDELENKKEEFETITQHFNQRKSLFTGFSDQNNGKVLPSKTLALNSVSTIGTTPNECDVVMGDIGARQLG